MENLRLVVDSPVKKIAVLFLTSLFVVCCSGILFGWASLRLVYQEEGVFHRLCTENQTTQVSNETSQECVVQELRLNLLYTSSAISIMVSAIPCGQFLDSFGPRKATTFGCAIMLVGLLLLGFSSEDFEAYFPGLISLAIGGQLTYLGVISIAEHFGKDQATVIGIYNMGFDASTVIFFLFQQLHKYFGLSSNQFFLAYLSIPISVLVCSLFWPRKPSEEEIVLQKANDEPELIEHQKISPLSDLTFFQQLKSPEMIGFCIYFAIYSLFSNMCFGTVEDRLSYFSDEATTQHLVEIYSIILPSSFIVSPIISKIINDGGYIFSFWLLQGLSLLWAGLNFVQSAPAQIVNFIVFSIWRGFFYSNAMVFVIKVFGYQNFGKLWGTAVTMAGTITMTQYVLLEVTFRYFNGSFVVANYLQLAVTILATLFAFYLTTSVHQHRVNGVGAPIATYNCFRSHREGYELVE